MDRWSQLSMSEKSDLMSLYIKNGISSLEEIKKHYNSYQDGGKITFQQWKDRMKTKYPDIEMDNDKAGYNYEEYFNNNYDAAIRQLDNLQHFPDTYKLPNHPTFSNESIYSRGPMIGGNWINDSTFNPSIINRRYYPNTYREDRPYTEREIYNSFATGGSMSPDHDPDNPYHYHNAKGEKIVITPEEWEENVGKPYFREVEAAVRAEQAAYPEPEYEVNPDFVRDLRSTYRSNMGNGYQNYRNFSSYLPQGYTFSSEGMIVDQQGNYYVQSGYRQTPRFTYSTENPLNVNLSSINKNLTFYPVNMDKRVKAPLPVDRVMNVSDAREKAIQNYINNNSKTKVQKMYNTPYVQTGVPYSKERFVAVPNSTNFSYDRSKYHVDIPFESNVSPEKGWDIIPNLDEYDWHFMNQEARPNVNLVQQAEQYSAEHPITEEEFDRMFNSYNSYINKAGSTGMNRIYPKEFWRNTDADKRIIIKPSRKEAEKKAIIKISPLEKVGNKRRRLETAGQLSD